MGAHVTVDPDLCIGSAECNRLAPKAFRLVEGLGISLPLPGAELVDRARLSDAEAGCPTGAITIGVEDEARS